MNKEKKQMTAEMLYKKNKKKAKIFKILSPVMCYLFLALAIMFFIMMIRNSIGNVMEILRLLDKDIYTGEQIEENYASLVQKWGEWEIVGAGTSGLVIRYVDVRNALFSGLMITYTVLTIICIALSIVLGKVLFPQLSKLFSDNNSEMVDIATLKSAAKIDEMSNNKNSTKEWF